MSRLTANLHGAPRARRLWNAISSTWYVPCIGLLGGCLYVGPEPYLNQPPEFVVPLNPEDGPFPIVLNSSTYITVTVSDVDSQEVECIWTIIGHETPTGTCTRTNELVTSVLGLPFDPELDGATVVATMYDLESDQGVAVEFTLVVNDPEFE